MDEQQHNRTKKKLRIVGGILLGVGVVCALVGFIDFALTFVNASNGGARFPSLFFLAMIGIPMIGLGAGLLVFSYKKEIGRYIKNESVPVINEAAEELKPAVKSVVSAVREGIKGDADEDKKEFVCPHCGKVNLDDGAFCSFCGKPMQKTCPICGAKQSGENVYCGKCGTRLD